MLFTGEALSSRLMSPVAITSDSGGNLYVGDYDNIRMIDADGNVENLFTFPHPPSAKVD